ncbi:type II toxin-antitoxin system HicA family toxin [Lysobacter antibioticus]|uniref:type II toxin-antitoxin system HicA family toxin n=1 Tax=Lysobacter antibioticus TaxID=84531 RepID=UPI0007E8E174
MGGHFPPVGTREVEAVLKHLGYEKRPQNGTSHVKWVKDENGKRRVVIVDDNNAPFKDQALAWIINPMGITKKQFYEILASL